MVFKIKFDGATFSEDEKSKVTTACGKIEATSSAALKALKDGTHAAVFTLWFGAASRVDLKKHLERMHAVIKDTNRTMTFVDVRGKSEKIFKTTNLVASFQAISASEVHDIPMTAMDYAYVKPVEGGCQSTAAHVGSGMRLFLGERYFDPSKGVSIHVAKIYHELTHKVLGTKDHVYGDNPSQQLALTDPAKSLSNADNYDWFIRNFVV